MQHVQCSRVTLNRASTCSSCMAMKMDQITWNTKAGQSASEFLAYTLLSFNDSALCNSELAGKTKASYFVLSPKIFCLISYIWGKTAVHCSCQGQKTAEVKSSSQNPDQFSAIPVRNKKDLLILQTKTIHPRQHCPCCCSCCCCPSDSTFPRFALWVISSSLSA